jgi:hypothetical protein
MLGPVSLVPAATPTTSWLSTSGSMTTWLPTRAPAGQGAQLVAGDVAAKLGLAGQAGLVVTERGPHQVQVQPP